MAELSEQSRSLVSAAIRHCFDSEWLVAASNPGHSTDQARHLAGFGPECARKATLRVRTLDRSLGHGFGDWEEDVIAYAVALDPVSLRYQPEGWSRRFPLLTSWNLAVRYDRTGQAAVDGVDVAALVAEAKAAVLKIVVAVWADGLYPDNEVPR